MNLAYFHLRTRPFRPTPDTSSYYPAATHENALTKLIQAIADDEGLLVLTGAPGTGKTLVGHLLLERLGDVAAAFITNCRFASRAELLRGMLFDLSQPHQGMSEQDMRFALTEYLLANFARGQKSVILLDEAQDLSPDLLEELRLLGNLESSRGKAVHVVLMGQPSLLESLRRPELASLQQRIGGRWQLEMLSLHEAADYLQHHIRVAGGNPEEVFSGEALSILAERTAGVPRLLNQAATACMTLAESVEAETIDAEVALEALAALGYEMNNAEEAGELISAMPPAVPMAAVPEHLSRSGVGGKYRVGAELNNFRQSVGPASVLHADFGPQGLMES